MINSHKDLVEHLKLGVVCWGCWEDLARCLAYRGVWLSQPKDDSDKFFFQTEDQVSDVFQFPFEASKLDEFFSGIGGGWMPKLTIKDLLKDGVKVENWSSDLSQEHQEVVKKCVEATKEYFDRDLFPLPIEMVWLGKLNTANKISVCCGVSGKYFCIQIEILPFKRTIAIELAEDYFFSLREYIFFNINELFADWAFRHIAFEQEREQLWRWSMRFADWAFRRIAFEQEREQLWRWSMSKEASK